MRTTKFANLTRRAFPLAVAAALLACGDDDGGPATIPDVTGLYTVTYYFEFVQGGARSDFSCPGAIDITTQTGETIRGTFSLTPQGDCRASAQEDIFVGTVTVDGTVTINNLFVGNFGGFQDPDGLVQGGACELFDGSGPVVGTISGDRLQAQASTEIECWPSQGGKLVFEVTLAIDGTRQ